MIRLILAIALPMVLANSLFGQDADQMREYLRNRAADNQRHWENLDRYQRSKKLSNLDVIPEVPIPFQSCLGIDALEPERIGCLDCYQFQVVRVVDEKNVVLLTTFDDRDILLWFVGEKEHRLVDSHTVRIVGPVRVGENKKYTTSAGVNYTINSVQLIPKDQIKNHISTPMKPGYEHEWTAEDGSVIARGKYLEIKLGKAKIELEDGSIVTHKFSDLSKGDREKIRQENIERKKVPRGG